MAPFTASERAAIEAVPAADSIEDLRLFGRVAPYFNGQYHIEDIMYVSSKLMLIKHIMSEEIFFRFHVNVRRSQVLQLVDKFRNLLIKVENEDPAVTMYFKKSIR